MTGFLGLLYMLGFVNGKGNGVGEYEYSRMLHKETMKQHVMVISQNLKLDGGFNGPGVSSLHVSKVSKKVLRILSTCALLETAEGMVDDFKSSPMTGPEAMGRDQDSSWQLWLRALVVVGFALMGLGYLIASGAITFGGGNVGQNQQGGGSNGPDCTDDGVPVQDEADGEEAGETASDRWYRYKNDSISECSDPEYWQQINHISWSSSECDGPQPNEVTCRVQSAFDESVDTVNESTLVSWLMSRCQRGRDEAEDNEKKDLYGDHVVALSTSWMDMCSNNAIPKDRLRGMLKEFAELSPRAESPTASMSRDDILGELLQMQSNVDSLESEAGLMDAHQKQCYGGGCRWHRTYGC